MERKVKYNYEFKLRCVEEVLKNHRSIDSVSKSNGFSKSSLGKWICFYEKYGNKGLLPRKNQNYSSKFKLKVLESIDKDSLTLKEACSKFNIPSDSVIVKWQRDYEQSGTSGLINKPRGRPRSMQFKRAKKKSNKPLTREDELLRENESLRAELDLLKKLQALIQAEQSKKRKP